jgi:hypothetical protein
MEKPLTLRSRGTPKSAAPLNFTLATMNVIEPSEFSQQLKASLSDEGLLVASLKISPYNGGGVHVEIDGDACITQIGIWPNGLFDVEYINLPSEKATTLHRELHSSEEALKLFVQEVRLAINRSSHASSG